VSTPITQRVRAPDAAGERPIGCLSVAPNPANLQVRQRGGNMSAKLTALIPCKDERRNIRPCIESVRGIADEILIADSGSTDGTLNVVREIGGCRIIEREYV